MDRPQVEELERSFRRFRTFVVTVSGGPPVGYTIWAMIASIRDLESARSAPLGLAAVILFLGIPLYLYWEFVRSPFGSIVFGLLLVVGMLVIPLSYILLTEIQQSFGGIGIVFWIPTVPWVVGLIGLAIDTSILYPLFRGRGRSGLP